MIYGTGLSLEAQQLIKHFCLAVERCMQCVNDEQLVEHDAVNGNMPLLILSQQLANVFPSASQKLTVDVTTLLHDSSLKAGWWQAFQRFYSSLIIA